VKEMEKIVEGVEGKDSFNWTYGYRRVSSTAASFLLAPYMIGVPKTKA